MIVCAVLQHSLKRLAFLCCKLQPANMLLVRQQKFPVKCFDHSWVEPDNLDSGERTLR